MYFPTRPPVAVTVALVAALAFATPVVADYQASPSGKYLELNSEVVHWYDNATHGTVVLGASDYDLQSCPRSDPEESSELSRCGYCGYVPEWIPTEPAGSTWRHASTQYTYGACVNAQVVGNKAVFRADARVKHDTTDPNANTSFRWYTWVRYEKQNFPYGWEVVGTAAPYQNVSCTNTPLVSYCASGVLEFMPNYPPTATRYCFNLALLNKSDLAVEAYLNASICES